MNINPLETGDTMTLRLQDAESSAIAGDMTTIDLDLLRARRFEIGKEIDALTGRIEALEKEAHDLDFAETVFLRLANHVGEPIPLENPSGKDRPDRVADLAAAVVETAIAAGKPEGIPTMPDMIKMVLREKPEGLEPKDIAEVIGKRWWPGVPVSSVGPIAWRMWKRSELDKEGARYKLLLENKKENGPAATASEPSSVFS